jgi:hypothetical protein
MKIIKLAVALLMTAWVSSANATLIFDFSWSTSSGVTSGEIRGLDASQFGTQAATSIVLKVINGSPVNVLLDNINGLDVFKIIADKLFVDSNFSASKDNGVLEYALYFYVYTQCQGICNPTEAFLYVNSGSPTSFGTIGFQKREVLVPEPGTVILLSLGLAGLSFARYRKQY